MTNTKCTSLAVINPDLNASISNLFQNYLDELNTQTGERHFLHLMQQKTNQVNKILAEREEMIRRIVKQRRAAGRFRNPLSILADVLHFNPTKKLHFRSDQEINNVPDSLDSTEREIVDGAIEQAFA